MNIRKILAIVLLAAGTLALVYKGVNYTRERHDAKLGPIQVTVKEKERIVIPAWLGVVLIGAGGGLLLRDSFRK